MKSSLKLFIIAATVAALPAVSFGADAAENWTAQCKKCHGADGAGQTPMGKRFKLKDYTSAEVQAALTDEEIVKAIKEGTKDANGKQTMPGYSEKGFTDDDVNALLAYIRAMKK